MLGNGWATRGVQAVDASATIPQKAQGLIGIALTHLLGTVPVTPRSVEVAAADQHAGLEPRFHRAGQGQDKGAHGVPPCTNARSIDLGPGAQVRDRLHDIRDHQARQMPSQ